MELLSYKFFLHSLSGCLLASITCSLIGVLIVLLNISSIGITLSHSAFAGALLGILIGKEPLIFSFLFTLICLILITVFSEYGQLKRETSISVFFSLSLGLIFLFLFSLPGTKTEGLNIFWGNILTISTKDLMVLGTVLFIIVLFISLFMEKIKVVIFNKELAISSGINANLIIFISLLLCGLAVVSSLQSIGGLLVYSLIVNPASSAYQITYNLKKIFLLSLLFGLLSGFLGLWFSVILDFPVGAMIVIISSFILVLTIIFSPKRKRVKIEKKEFFDRSAHNWKNIEKEKIERVIMESEIKKGERICDVGTGTGVLIPFLVEKIGKEGEIYAIDISGEMLKIAKEKNFYKNVYFLERNIEETNFKSEYFDKVICNNCFCHFDNKKKAIMEIKRILKKNGIFIISHTDGREKINQIHKSFSILKRDLILPAEKLARYIEKFGFKRIKIYDEGSFYFLSFLKQQD